MDQKTVDTYNKMAKEYADETINFWQRFPRTFFDAFTERIQEKVLDVGSGPGRDGLLLQEKGINVVCLDASTEMIKMCEEKGLESILGDFSALPCEDNSFAGVWAYTSLLHVPKSEISKALSEIHRVLQNGGILGLGMIEGNIEGYRESSGVTMPRWFSFYTKAEIERLLAQHGFSILYFEQFQPRSKNYLNFITQKQ